MKGLEWLARVGPSPLDPWRYAMGWSEVAARNHARRLEREGWLERCPMVRGQGSLFLATRKGIRVLGLPLIAARTPAPTWWAHDSACAWTAAWLTFAAGGYLGPREILDDPEWSGELDWLDRHSFKRSWHRPTWSAFWLTERIRSRSSLRRSPSGDSTRSSAPPGMDQPPAGRAASSTSAATRKDGGALSEPASGRALSRGQAPPNRATRHDQGADRG